MHFYEQLNQYMKVVNCTAKELCTVSGISAAALSRYRSGERVPDVHSETFEQLCSALETLALKREGTNLTKTEIPSAISRLFRHEVHGQRATASEF